MRTRKTINNTVTDYYYNGSLLMGMVLTTTDSSGTETSMLRFSYDANGKVVAVNYNGTYYYYLRNAQGDIVKLIDKTGTAVVEYTYDTWGKLLSTTGSLAETFGKEQPFRYRGYVYDEETGWYYLQSRYYNPEIGRFISSDVYLSTGQGVLGHNAYAYCGNNPLVGYDPYGTFDLWGFIEGAGRIVTGIAAVVAGVAVCVAGAPVAMIAVAAVTITAGVLTAVNGTADIQQSVTGNNFVRDTVFNGNQTAYDVYSGVTETVAVAGTAICGNYLSNTCTMKGAVPGTEGKVTLEPGTTLDRYGSQYGRYLTDPGTSLNQLALPPDNSCNLTTYVVNRPFTFRTGTVAPCAWGPGGGSQYFSWMSVRRLVQFGFLTPLD